jgi:hypothetical protein
MPAISTLTREEFLEQLSPLSVSACAAVDSETACVICTSEPVDTPVLETEERAVLLHGRHTFGETCAREWLAHNNTCPKCRAVLFQEDSYEFADYDEQEPVFRPDDLEYLLRQARDIGMRNPRTGAYGDDQLMMVYLRLWAQWRMAILDANDDGEWDCYGAASTRVANALHNLAETRLTWYRESPQRLNVNLVETFTDPWRSLEEPSRDELNYMVDIDFGCDMQSDFRDYLNKSFAMAHNERGVCRNMAGHPLAFDLFRRLEGFLERYAGSRLRVSSLIRMLRTELGHREDLEARRDLPIGYSSFVEYLVDATWNRAIHEEYERREARRAERARARAHARARARPVSTCPRMSAPSRPE